MQDVRSAPHPTLTTMFRLAASLLAVALGGYLLIALLQALSLELLLGGRVAPDASWGIQFAGVAGTVVSGLVGGYVVAWIGSRLPWAHVSAVLAPLVLDTVYVLTKDADGHPLWFNLAGSATLVVATVCGGWLRIRTHGGQSARPKESRA